MKELKESNNMLKRITSALLLGAVLVFGAGAAFAQPVVNFTVETSTGNDTLFVGIPGAIIFNAELVGTPAAGDGSVSAFTFPMGFTFTNGNIFGPVEEAPSSTDAEFEYSAAANVFENRPFNSLMGDDFVDAPYDTLLWGCLDFNGAGWIGSGEVGRITVSASDTGCVTIDSTLLAPANHLSALDQNAGDIPITWGGPYTVCFILRPNEAPICNGASVDNSTYVYGDLVTGSISGSDPDDGPGPLGYVLLNASNSNATGPNNPFMVDGSGNWSWQTSNANTDDVGIWTVFWGVEDGEDTVECAPVTFEVIAQKPLVCFGFECIEAFSGQDVCVGLYVADFLNPCKELGGFDLLFQYDGSLLTFLGLDLTGSILEGLGWEYLTYRIEGSNPAKVRIVAIADMNNSNQHPSGYCLDGLLAKVCFRTTNDRNLACQSAWLSWCWNDCGDNTASSKDGNDLYIVADPANGPWIGGNAQEGVDGGGIISACVGETENLIQLFTGEGGLGGPADHPCLNEDRTKPDPIECLYFVNGKIKIKCPGDIDDRGDINLNGLAYEIADAVLYSNYFIHGPAVFYPGVQGEAQVAASDINADGTPLTVADLVYLIRVITGDAEPIAEDLLGGGPKVASTVGKIDVEQLTQGGTVTVRASSDLEMGAGLFTFKYTGTDHFDVSALGRASDMRVITNAENGELRVLLVPDLRNEQVEKSRVAAGEGEILAITGGDLELISVEAASFDGGMLESNVTAKVLPTAFALHQNYPNPFNPSTSMSFDFPTSSRYELTIYNIAGQVVKKFEGQAEAGTHEITWMGVDSRGASVATGVYFYAFKAGDFEQVRKMVLMK
jgi:hypothetical protein